MIFLKQLRFFLVLSGLFTCISTHTLDNHSQDVISILKVIGKAVESELAFIDIDDDQDDVDLIQVGQSLQQKLPIIVTKVSNAVKHDLTKNQQAIVIDLLHNLQTLSAFTINDLMEMEERCSTYAKREADNKAFEKYVPKKLKEKFDDCRSRNGVQEEYILLTKELEKVDFHNESFNLLTKFMCQCCYIIDIDLMTKVDLGDDKLALPLQKCCRYLAEAIAFPFAVFNDFYFFPGWEKEFEKTGNMFLMVNSLSSALLKSIENQ